MRSRTASARAVYQSCRVANSSGTTWAYRRRSRIEAARAVAPEGLAAGLAGTGAPDPVRLMESIGAQSRAFVPGLRRRIRDRGFRSRNRTARQPLWPPRQQRAET